MIGTVALARRIEAAEARLSLAMAAVTRRSVPEAFGLAIGTGAAIYCGAGAPMTKVIGVGVGEPLADADIDRVEAAFAPYGEQPGWEMCTLGDLSAIARLEARGYRLRRIELVLGRDLTRDAVFDPLPTNITVERGYEDDWARIAVAGFAAAETVEGREVPAEAYDTSMLEQVIAQFAGVESVRRYVAFVDGTPAGAASARADAGVFQLCGAATLPEWRRRGVQTALLVARLAEARADGCELAVVTVEPGSRSQANVQRRHFLPLYSRLVLARS